MKMRSLFATIVGTVMALISVAAFVFAISVPF
jgi:hypothetical protein